MSGSTAAYLARLEVWGLLAVLLQAGLLLLSWRLWSAAIPRENADARHRLACAHFAGLLLLPALTLLVLHWTVTVTGFAAAGQGLEPGPPSIAVAAYQICIHLAVPLAAVWALGFAAMLTRLTSQAVRLRTLSSAPAPTPLTAMVRRLSRSSGLKRHPLVRVAAVRAPQVSGWRRPILLAPPGLERVLGGPDLQAVLLHELTHVRAGDFAWNLGQRLVLATLWFHPAAWILYRGVAAEREARCDAAAVRHGACPAALARALVRLAEAGAGAGLAMPLAGRSDLGDRISRLVGCSRREPPWRRAALAAAGLSCAACVGVLGAVLPVLAGGGALDPAMGGLGRASLLGPTVLIQAHDRAGSFQLRIRRGRVLAASIDQSELGPERIRQRGERVVLMGPKLQPVLHLTVRPEGAVRWTGRS